MENELSGLLVWIYSTPLITNPVLPVYTVDVVSRFSEDWDPANIVAVLIVQGLSALASVSVTTIKASTRVWVLLASELKSAYIRLRQLIH